MKLKPNAYQHLTVKELKPAGWLREQLRIQADGLCGNLDKIWPDIRDSRWIGGPCEGWERVPCWLDGFLPLAYLLDDPDLKSRAKRYIDEILARQQWDGWICPCSDEERRQYDIWPAFLMCKVLVLYYECTDDERIEEAVARTLRQMLDHLMLYPLHGWAAARWFECLIPAYWLYERRPESWLRQLISFLSSTGFDYEQMTQRYDYTRPAESKYWRFPLHVVNMSMALKSPVLAARFTGKEESNRQARRIQELLFAEHGTGIGHFTGDECLSGTSPIQGTELCGIAEAMYSYECLFEMTGDPHWADSLELLAFNSLPAAFLPDMWTHQYVQQVNQVECSIQKEEDVPFNSNNGEAHIFGLEPHYGCCTANHGQAFPKFALSAVMRSEQGIAVVSPVPCRVDTALHDSKVTLEVQSDYPFRDSFTVKIDCSRPTAFTLEIRVPAEADFAEAEGKPYAGGSMIRIERTFSHETIEVKYAFHAHLCSRPDGMMIARRGQLFYSIPLAYEKVTHEYVKENNVWASYNVCTKSVVEHKFPYCDYELLPRSKFNYAFADGELRYHERAIGKMPFRAENAPVSLTAKVCEIDWPKEHGMCTPLPRSTEPLSDAREIELIPYGCTDLRITQIPLSVNHN